MYFSISLLITFSRQIAMIDPMCSTKSVPRFGVKRVGSVLPKLRLPIRRVLRSSGTRATLCSPAGGCGNMAQCWPGA